MPQTTLPNTLTKQFYAGVGATDLAVEAVRDYVADAQKRVAEVQKRLAEMQDSLTKSVADFEPETARKQATVAVNARFDALSKDAKARRELVESRIAELQKEALALPARVQELVTELVNDNVTTLSQGANEAYDDLVARGEKLVARIRRQRSTQDAVAEAKVTVAKAKTTKTQATKAAKFTKSTAKGASTRAKKAAATPRSSAKATATAARKTAASAAKAVADAAEKIGD